MTEVHIKMHGAHLGAVDGESALETALRIIGVGFGEEGGWNSKYGADYENDVFLMRRHCWCDKEGECPWCTGCAVYQTPDGCPACAARDAHALDCFEQEVSRRFKAAGISWVEYDANGRYVQWHWVDAQTPREEHWQDRQDAKIKEALRVERGLAEAGCDCPAKAAGDALRAAGKTCDYDRGTGIFAPFKPYLQLPERHYYDPPNFWFKPSDFRVTWYKYIGRDMAANRDSVEGDFLAQVFATHPRGMTVEQAIEAYAAETNANREAFASMMASLGVRPSTAPAEGEGV